LFFIYPKTGAVVCKVGPATPEGLVSVEIVDSFSFKKIQVPNKELIELDQFISEGGKINNYLRKHLRSYIEWRNVDTEMLLLECPRVCILIE